VNDKGRYHSSARNLSSDLLPIKERVAAGTILHHRHLLRVLVKWKRVLDGYRWVLLGEVNQAVTQVVF
jgi:hypothetical protein